ncbi:MAG: arginine repressor [Lachnospiraceae bacterium]|nr:arginine repressor [Lachnospiraceae bacterium]
MKAKRQEKIIEIIEKYNIETQDELAEAGFYTTQATISRDIRELKLTKLAYPGGKQKYIALKNRELHVDKKYKRVLSDAIIHVEAAQNIIVVKTVTGMAMACATAIDSLGISGIVGTIAGDDTIMCIAKDNDYAKDAIESLKKEIS